MNGARLLEWLPLAGGDDVRWLKYSFGLGTANSLAVKLKDKTWMVISPASKVPEFVYETLEKHGAVSALVAPNAYHNMGQPAWRERFPNAFSYAPRGAISRLSKKTPAIDYRPVEKLGLKLGSTRFLLPDGMKSPDVMIQISTDSERIWWTGDLLSNSGVSDQTWPLRMLSRLAGGGLGCRCNSKPELVYVRDRAAWIRSVRSALDGFPPSIVVPAHGDPVTESAAEQTRRALDAIDPSSGIGLRSTPRVNDRARS